MKSLLPSLPALRSVAGAGLLALAGLATAPFHAAADYVLSAEEEPIAGYLVNDPGQERPALRLDPILARIARERAEDMAARDYFAHVNPDGLAANALVLDAGYILPSAWGTGLTNNYIESIAAGYSAAADTWAGWMDSAPHRTHLLALVPFYQNQTSYGVGYAYSAASAYRSYWVVITAPPNVPEPNAALVVSQSTPPAMTAGQTYSVAVTMLNTGSNPWTQATGYRLAPLTPPGLPPVPVPADVTPGSAVTFRFTVTAPASPGSADFQWRMEQEGSGPFGEASANAAIPVGLPAPPPPPPSSSSSSSASPGSYSAPGSSSSKKSKKKKKKKKK